MKRRLFCIALTLLLASCGQSSNAIQGYVDARYTYVASDVTGRLVVLPVTRGEGVHTNELLFILSPEPEKSELDEAQAAVVQAAQGVRSAKAGLKLAALTEKRQTNLAKNHAAAIQDADQAQSQYAQALAQWRQSQANLVSAQAALAKAQWSYSEKQILSVKTGVVFDTYYLPGELVPANQPVLSILSPQDVYGIFYVSAKTLAGLQLNEAVTIHDGGQAIPAKISYLSPTAEYTPPVIYSDQTNQDLVFRVEATPDKPSLDLHPGEPVSVSIG